MPNWDLKIALIQKYHSQIVASRKLKIPENRLSYIVNGHISPSPRQREILKVALGRDFFAQEDEGPRAA